jgi:hypothetical protein
MNKQQLEHLNRRLEDKITAAAQMHPNTARINKLDLQKTELTGNAGALKILGLATKSELQTLVGEFISAKNSAYYSELLKKIFELPAAVTVNQRIARIVAEINALQRVVDQQSTELRKKKAAVYDLAIFADSPEDVLKAIESFLGE